MNKASKGKDNSHRSLETLMNKYLLHYWSSIHMTTKLTSSRLVFQPKMLLNKNFNKIRECTRFLERKLEREDKFKVGDEIHCRDYRNPYKKTSVREIIYEVLGQFICINLLMKMFVGKEMWIKLLRVVQLMIVV